MLGSAAGFAFQAAGWLRSPLFLAIMLSSSSLGLVVPVLADALQSRTLLSQLTIAGATLGEFGTITLLSLFFSATRAGTASNAITFGIFGVAAAAVALTSAARTAACGWTPSSPGLQDTTAETPAPAAITHGGHDPPGAPAASSPAIHAPASGAKVAQTPRGR